MSFSLKRLACSLVAVLSITAPTLAQNEADAKRIDDARKYVGWLREGSFDKCVAASDATMGSALPAEKLAEMWKSIETNFGAYDSEISASVSKIGQYQSVVLVSKFANSALDVRITFDADGKVAGLFFAPSAQSTTYEPPDYASPKDFEEVPVTVGTTEFPLDGTLTLPRQGAPFSAVVLVHGSGPHDQDETIFGNKPFKDLAWGLASNRIAVLRYEKRTKKYGATMEPSTVTIDTETADDAVAAVHFLMKRSDIRADRVYVIGHSLGATAAPYIASREKRIAGIVMMAAAARPLYELVADQVNYLANTDGAVSDEESKAINEAMDVVNKLRAGKADPGDMLLGVPAQYWKGLDRMDPVGFATKLDRPMLILQGARDYQVTYKDYAIWKDRLHGRKNATLRRYDKLDHLFHAGEGPSTPDQYQRKGYVDAVVIRDIAAWIKDNE
ncbi:MAG: alpha/beta fold hydrolase [Phycisphaerales bacterium]|nr:alpha/beta fold hydrolase [Phycisphaerales bacterium]MCB9863689.1 alpha/beta fold hydrolase [Phycisphaerales bacterium]